MTVQADTPADSRRRIKPTGRATKAHDADVEIDIGRCVMPDDSEDLPDAAWIAVVGSRDDVDSDVAKKLAARYWVGDRGGVLRQYGPIPDGDNVTAPVERGEPQSVSHDAYVQRALSANSTRNRTGRYVCFFLIRDL